MRGTILCWTLFKARHYQAAIAIRFVVVAARAKAAISLGEEQGGAYQARWKTRLKGVEMPAPPRRKPLGILAR